MNAGLDSRVVAAVVGTKWPCNVKIGYWVQDLADVEVMVCNGRQRADVNSCNSRPEAAPRASRSRKNGDWYPGR